MCLHGVLIAACPAGDEEARDGDGPALDRAIGGKDIEAKRRRCRTDCGKGTRDYHITSPPFGEIDCPIM